MRKLIMLLLLLAMAVCSGGSVALADILYTNLGPTGSAYNATGGWAICGSGNDPNNCELFSAAMQFSAVASGNVTQIDLAVSYVNQNNEKFNASIWTDVNGQPGTQVTGAYWDDLISSNPALQCCGLVTLSGLSGVSLEGGQSYFMVLNPMNLTGMAYFVWNSNNQGATGLELYSTNGGFNWNSNGIQTICAFDILGTPVPEPTTLLLVCTGIGGLILATWRKRK
jgi:hypothetical protein